MAIGSNCLLPVAADVLTLEELLVKGRYGWLGLMVFHYQRNVGFRGALAHHLHVDLHVAKNLENL